MATSINIGNFINHLHGGELEKNINAKDKVFINHLHGGE